MIQHVSRPPKCGGVIIRGGVTIRRHWSWGGGRSIDNHLWEDQQSTLLLIVDGGSINNHLWEDQQSATNTFVDHWSWGVSMNNHLREVNCWSWGVGRSIDNHLWKDQWSTINIFFNHGSLGGNWQSPPPRLTIGDCLFTWNVNFDFTRTLSPELWDLWAPRHPMQSTGLPLGN